MFQGLNLEAPVSAGVAISGGLLTTLLGMIVVFIALVALVFLTFVMSKAIRSAMKKGEAEGQGPSVHKGAEPEFSDRGSVVAAVSAAIACAIGKTGGGFRIHSITKLD